jgi:hypothetical protein
MSVVTLRDDLAGGGADSGSLEIAGRSLVALHDWTFLLGPQFCFRNGEPVDDCADLSAAAPDPCVASRSTGSDGDVLVSVRTTHFSRWNFARPAYAFGGFLRPLAAAPTVNVLAAGRAVPLKFSLGGDHGLDIFQPGYPAQV